MRNVYFRSKIVPIMTNFSIGFIYILASFSYFNNPELIYGITDLVDVTTGILNIVTVQ